MTDQQAITDEGDFRQYRAEIPHMADDELDPDEYRLYGHYKRVCGEYGGMCYEAVRTTAKKTQMSVGQVVDARNRLATKGWIEMHTADDTQFLIITILNRWLENLLRYASDEQLDRLGINRSHREQLGTNTVHTMNSRSQGEPKNLEEDEDQDSDLDQSSSSSLTTLPTNDSQVEIVRGVRIPEFYRTLTAFEVWAREFPQHPLTQFKGEELGDWIDQLGEREVIAGILLASLNQARSPLAYVQTIFAGWTNPDPLAADTQFSKYRGWEDGN